MGIKLEEDIQGLKENIDEIVREIQDKYDICRSEAKEKLQIYININYK